MKRFVVACTLVVGISFLAPANVSAQVFMDGFESYATGGVLPPQGGWSDFGGTETVNVSSTQAHSGANSMRLREGLGAGNPVAPGYGSDVFRNFSGLVTTGQVFFSYWQFVEPTVDTIGFNFISTGAMPTTFQTGLDIRTVSDITGVNGGNLVLAVQGATIVGQAPQVFGAWAEHVLAVNLNGNVFDYSYNGALIVDDGIWDAAAPVSFGGINFWMQFNNTNGVQDFVYYDDFSLTVVPEPSSMLLAPLGIAGWKLLRRRKK